MTARNQIDEASSGAPASGEIHTVQAELDEETSAGDQRRRVADEISTRLRRNGVLLLGTETLEQIGDLLESVERFEEAVEQRGGDLMVDEPINGVGPIAPDEPDFLLPRRRGEESVASFMGRIDAAASALRRNRRIPLSAGDRRR